MQAVFGAKASPFVILRVYPTLTTSLVGVSEFFAQAMETMSEYLELLGESLIFPPVTTLTTSHLYLSLSTLECIK